MRAKDCVPAGGSFHASAGETFFPVQAYFAGMDCPFVNASLVSSRDMVASIAGVSKVATGSVAIIGSDMGVVEDVHAAITTASRRDIARR
jgi:hypothetical protein